MTERLYLEDAYEAETEANVISKEQVGDRFHLVLDRTIFCPKGGGQPEDHGTINGLPVLELIVADDEIVHLLSQDPGIGKMRLAIDFSRRYDHMQQHTAQHLLSQVLKRDLGIETLSFSIGAGHSSIELSVEVLTEAQLDFVEEACAAIVFACRPVVIFEADDASEVPLRKPAKKEGSLRVVEILDFDHSACGGTHVRNTGELGMVKIVRCEKVRGHLRLYYLAGLRALRDYEQKNRLLAAIQRLVTVPGEQIPEAIARMISERNDLEREVKAYRRKELDSEIAASMQTTDPLVVRRFDRGGLEEMRYFIAAILKSGKHVLAYHPALQYVQIGRGSGSVDLKSLAPEIFAALSGKGGGRDSLIEGQATDFSRIDQLIVRLKEIYAI